MDTGKDMKTTLHHRSKEKNCLTNKMAEYVHPDYPDINTVEDFRLFTYNGRDQQMNSQPMYYGGTGCMGYVGCSYDPESRRVSQQQQPFVQQPMFAQPQVPQAPQQLQPFSAYGGSGAQAPTSLPAMPTLDSRRVPTTAQVPAPTMDTSALFGQPLLQPSFPGDGLFPPMIHDDRVLPLFSDVCMMPSIDNSQQIWNNQYVTPRTVQTPVIQWNKPATEPRYIPQYQQSPFVQQPNMQLTWTEIYAKNKMAQI